MTLQSNKTIVTLVCCLLGTILVGTAHATSPWTELLPTTEHLPTSRDFHASARCVQAGLTVVFGGRHDDYDLLNDVWVYQTSTTENSVEWLELISPSTDPTHPSPRRGSSLVVTDEYSEGSTVWCRLILYGGETFNVQGESDAWVLDISSSIEENENIQSIAGEWSLVQLSGALVPAARSDHVAVYRRGSMYIYGGIVAISTYYSKLHGDVWSLTIEENKEAGSEAYIGTWTLLSQAPSEFSDNDSSQHPSPRSAAAGGLYLGTEPASDRLIVHGGRAYAEESNDWTVLDDVWSYSFVQNKWYNRLGVGSSRVLSYSRIFHSGVVVGEYFVVFGGYSRYTSPTGQPEGFVFNDVLVTKINDPTHNTIYCPLASEKHQGVEAKQQNSISNTFTDNKNHETDTDSSNFDSPSWCRLINQVGEKVPHVRWAHSATLDEYKLQIFGGQFRTSSNQLWNLDLSIAFTQLEAAGSEESSYNTMLESINELMIALLIVMVFAFSALIVAIRRQRSRRRFLLQSRVKKRGAKPEVIRNLPIVRYRSQGVQSVQRSNSACLDSLEIVSCPSEAEPELGPEVDDPQQEEMCPICLVEFENEEQIRELPCRHIFHPDCIDTWLVREKFCPMCKQNVENESTTMWEGRNTIPQPVEMEENAVQPSAPEIPRNFPLTLVTTVDQLSLPVAVAIDEIQINTQQVPEYRRSPIRRVQSHNVAHPRHRKKQQSRRKRRHGRNSASGGASTSGHSTTSQDVRASNHWRSVQNRTSSYHHRLNARMSPTSQMSSSPRSAYSSFSSPNYEMYEI